MTAYRILELPVARLEWRGGVVFLEQELTRCSHGGFALMRGASQTELRHGTWRKRRHLRFLFEQGGTPDSPDHRHYVATYVALRGKPAGDAHLYAREATEMLNTYSKHGYEIAELLEWPGRWLLVHERSPGRPPVAARYEAMAVPRSEVRRDRPAPWPHDRPTIGVLSTQTHLFPIQVVSASRRDGAA